MLKKAVIYVRVSSSEQKEQGYSPEAQKRLLWAFARENGYDVAEEFEDAETAKQAGRTAFNLMLRYVRERGIKNILVEKTDRLHRNFSDYVLVEDLTKECDVTVHFVKEGVSIGKDAPSSQKFMYGVRTLMAKNFIDNLREEVIKGLNEKLALGEFPSKAPLGYLNAEHPITRKACIVVDEANKPLVQAIYKLYATGDYSLKSLVAAIEGQGLAAHLPRRRRLNKTTMDKTLRNPFYIGNFIWKGKVYRGSHEAIIDTDLWQRVQDLLHGKNRNHSKKHNVIPFVYKGLLTCGECHRSITAELKKKKYVYYRCTKYDTNCTQRPVKQETIDAEASALLGQIKLSDNGQNYVVAGLKQSLEEKRAWHDKAYKDMVRERATLKDRLDRMYEDRLDGKVNEEFYEHKFSEYTDRLKTLEAKLAQHDKADINYYEFGLKVLELAKNAGSLFKMATTEEKHEILRYLLSNSTLKDGKPSFALKQPFSEIAKRSQSGERSTWYALLDDFRTFDWQAAYHDLTPFPSVAVRVLGWTA